MIQKMTVILLTFVALALVPLAIGGCRTQKAGPYFVDERPIIIVDTGTASGKTTLHFTCLNREECLPALETGWEFASPNNPVMDREANLYLPFYNRSDIYYVDSEQRSTRHVEPDFGLEGFFMPPYPLYAHGKIVLASRDGIILVINEDSSHEVIQLELAGKSTEGAIGGLVQGNDNEVLAFNQSPVKKGEQDFAQVFVIDLDSGDVTEELLPAPSSMGSPPDALTEEITGARYILLLVGIGKDLDRLYYTFHRGGKVVRTRLGMFDTKDRKELRVYESPSGCLPTEGYRQHGETICLSSQGVAHHSS